MEDMNTAMNMEERGMKVIKKINDVIRVQALVRHQEESHQIHRHHRQGSHLRRVQAPKVIVVIVHRNRSQNPNLMEHNNS